MVRYKVENRNPEEDGVVADGQEKKITIEIESSADKLKSTRAFKSLDKKTHDQCLRICAFFEFFALLVGKSADFLEL